jgi:hypothetical protein
MAEAGWWWLAIAGMAVGDALLFWLGYTWHARRGWAPGKADASVDPTMLREDIDRFNAALNAMQLCITGVEEKVGRLQDGVPVRAAGAAPQAAPPSVSEAQRSEPVATGDDGLAEEVVRIAQRLARFGANAAELSRACGLPPGEAELISRLTRLGGTPGPATAQAPGGQAMHAGEATTRSRRLQPSAAVAAGGAVDPDSSSRGPVSPAPAGSVPS